jgi:hypothetical protein
MAYNWFQVHIWHRDGTRSVAEYGAWEWDAPMAMAIECHMFAEYTLGCVAIVRHIDRAGNTIRITV